MPETSTAQPLLCPLCSAPPLLEIGVQWGFARRTSEKRNVRCAFMVGCAHIAAVAGPGVIEAGQVSEKIAAWNAAALGHFERKTQEWSPAQRAAFRLHLRYPDVSTHV